MTAADSVPFPFAGPCFGPAIVREVDAAAMRVRVQRRADGQPAVWARAAMSDPAGLRAGDEVLVAGDDGDGLYVVGCLTPRAHGLALSRRHRAVVGDDRVLRIVAGDGDVLLEVDARSDMLRVTARTGALEVAAPGGDLLLRSSGAVRIDGRELQLGARDRAHIAVQQAPGQPRSALNLEPARAALHSPAFDLTAARGEFHVAEGRYVGQRFVAALDSARLVAQRLETLCRTLVGRARNVYHTVAELVQLRAGRLRTLVDGTVHQKSRRALLKTDEDFKVHADRIHLGWTGDTPCPRSSRHRPRAAARASPCPTSA
jgi:hypothetical protein